ncbi:hypothetical protein SCG7109_AE_00230 [Chlamydiales bacterium SCGC AG-110-M15]|nr:hypothetical protein SCG7109_AE_00230 [Chlamydiales bacterium SCGC AG-110-M15]
METQSAATGIIKTLTNAGHTAYFAGGWVRDLLLGLPSDDIDIATSAHPDEVKALFPKTVAVGAAFGVIIVLIDDHQFEVASFRSDGLYTSGRRPETVHYSTPEEDAERRDFTINGMFYDPINAFIHDYVGGQQDLKNRILRAIGNADERFEEDRLRMIRAVRFAVRFNLDIEDKTRKAIKHSAPNLLPDVSMERIWHELQKMAKDGRFYKALDLLLDFGLLQVIFPDLKLLSQTELNELIKPIRRLPSTCPPVAHIVSLFPHYDIDAMRKLCRYLKMSNKDRFLAEFLVESRSLFDSGKEKEKADWARFYAFPDSQICLEVYLSFRNIKESTEFIETHDGRKKELAPHIERLRHRRLLLNAGDLKNLGIETSPIMGELIREADRIAINENILNPRALISRIMQSPLWPKGVGECK